MSTQNEIHNRIAGDIVKSIVKPPLEAGGGVTDILVVLESVVLGVILVCAKTKLGAPEKVLEALVSGVKARLAERLNSEPSDGSA